jgi:hypothetical protein
VEFLANHPKARWSSLGKVGVQGYFDASRSKVKTQRYLPKKCGKCVAIFYGEQSLTKKGLEK